MKGKTFFAVIVLFAVLCLGTGFAAEQPHSIIHVITIKWKEGTTQDQINAVLKAAQDMAGSYPGITRIWTKSLKVQGEGYKNAIVMEFASEDAFKKYAGSEAQKKWYAVYQPVREASTTHDITN